MALRLEEVSVERGAGSPLRSSPAMRRVGMPLVYYQIDR